MKTRIWKLELTVKDTPEYDEHGVPYPYLLKKEVKEQIEKYLNNELTFTNTEITSIKMIGHEGK